MARRRRSHAADLLTRASDDRGAAIDHERLTRDVATRIGGEQQRRAHEIGVAAELPEWCLTQKLIPMLPDDHLGHS
jgi:hypothetical protein